MHIFPTADLEGLATSKHSINKEICVIMEYGSTPYIGMAQEKNGCPIACVQSDMFKTLPET